MNEEYISLLSKELKQSDMTREFKMLRTIKGRERMVDSVDQADSLVVNILFNVFNSIIAESMKNILNKHCQ